MAAAAILEITFLAIGRPYLHIFAPNFIQRLKTGSRSRFTVKIRVMQKSKMAADDILKSVKRPQRPQVAHFRTNSHQCDTETGHQVSELALPSKFR